MTYPDSATSVAIIGFATLIYTNWWTARKARLQKEADKETLADQAAADSVARNLRLTQEKSDRDAVAAKVAENQSAIGNLQATADQTHQIVNSRFDELRRELNAANSTVIELRRDLIDAHKHIALLLGSPPDPIPPAPVPDPPPE